MIRVCAACGASNRVPASHLSDTGRCGSCKSALPPISEPIEVDPSSFNEIVEGARVPVLVDFWASWCPPCRAVAPVVHDLAHSMAGRAIVLKVDTERHPSLAAQFRVQSIPNFVVLRHGQPVFQQAGAVPRDQMQRWLESAGASAA